MGVYLLTKPDLLKVCVQLALKIERTGNEVTVFTDPSEFYAALKLQKKGEVDYVMIDVRTFQLDIYNPYTDMATMPYPVPVVIFNDPYPEPDYRAAYWIAKNKRYLVPLISESAIESFHPEFFLIESYLNSDELNRYVSVINRPDIFLTPEERSRIIDLEAFRLRHRITPSRFKVFRHLYENLGKEISSEELVSLLFGSYSPEKRKVVFSYIYDLRKACRNETSVQIRIDREYKGRYAMKILPLQDEPPQ